MLLNSCCRLFYRHSPSVIDDTCQTPLSSPRSLFTSFHPFTFSHAVHIYKNGWQKYLSILLFHLKHCDGSVFHVVNYYIFKQRIHRYADRIKVLKNITVNQFPKLFPVAIIQYKNHQVLNEYNILAFFIMLVKLQIAHDMQP